MPFPLSDASALLMRLEMGDAEVKAGLDLKDRWRELAQVGYEKMDSVNNVFYDCHMLVKNNKKSMSKNII